MIAQHLSNSGEHYTPPDVVELVHRVLGRIDLDPFSSDEANKTVQADSYWTADDGYDALFEPWDTDGGQSRVFINAPGTCMVVDEYGQKHYPQCKGVKRCKCDFVSRAWGKLLHEIAVGNVSDAIWVGFSCAQIQSLQWQNVRPRHKQYNWQIEFPDYGPAYRPTCFISKRLPFVGANGKPQKNPTHNNFITLLSGDAERNEKFVYEFSAIGVVTQRA